MLKILKLTIDCYIKRLRLVKKLNIWIPHELKEIHLRNRINACDLHLKRNEFDPFLKQIITGDEKWIVYDNVVYNIESWIASKKDYAVCLVKFERCGIFWAPSKELKD